jgi:Flp pilus assembly pilin Flp
MKTAMNELLRDDCGLTTVEYAVAGALITVTMALAFTSLGSAVQSVIEFITSVI